MTTLFKTLALAKEELKCDSIIHPQLEDTKHVKLGQLYGAENTLTTYGVLTLLFQDQGGRKMSVLTLDKDTILSQST